MTGPRVVAIMLANGRPEMAQRAIRSFHSQTYGPKSLFVYDTGDVPSVTLPGVHFMWEEARGRAIGTLRNCAIAAAYLSAKIEADIVVHWDSDDWSHPSRIAEQVEFLQDSGCDAVGYREMLFWREQHCPTCGEVGANSNCADDPMNPKSANPPITPGEAWLYSNDNPTYCLGTSLCYWRRVWQQRPFEALPKPGEHQSEDGTWLNGVRSVGTSPMSAPPRMIASIHPGNTSQGYCEAAFRSAEWRRVPEWDQHAREVMAP